MTTEKLRAMIELHIILGTYLTPECKQLRLMLAELEKK